MPASSIILPVTNAQKNLQFFTSLHALVRRFARYKIFHPLAPVARSVLYTAEPAGNVLIDSTPPDLKEENCNIVTIISANLWHDFPHYRRLDQRMDDFISMVSAENADILLLQEVARTPLLHIDEKLAGRLNMAHIYSRVNGHRGAIGFEEGLAIFSRYPIRKPSLQQLSGNGNPFTRRLVLGALLDTPCGDLFAFTTHLAILSRENTMQAAKLQEWVNAASGKSTAIIGGDFNASENKLKIKQTQNGWIDTFRRLNPAVDAATHELRGPFGRVWCRRRLDYIFLKPGTQEWKAIESRHLQIPHAPHSDHHAVLTRLVLRSNEFTSPQGSPRQ